VAGFRERFKGASESLTLLLTLLLVLPPLLLPLLLVYAGGADKTEPLVE
jgi:ABC-type molybdate transport system permease subunit